MRLGKSACCVRGFSINLPHSGLDSPVPCGGRATRLLGTLVNNRCFLVWLSVPTAPQLLGAGEAWECRRKPTQPPWIHLQGK